MRGWGEGRDVFVCALRRVLAATAKLPFQLLQLLVMLIAWLLLFAQAPPLLDPVAIYLLLRQLQLRACSDGLHCR